jgi:hypothetical protein
MIQTVSKGFVNRQCLDFFFPLILGGIAAGIGAMSFFSDLSEQLPSKSGEPHIE